MYDRNITAEILGDLREEVKYKTGKKPTFKELSKDIEEKFDVYISDTSLCDYENTAKHKEMNVKNLIVLAEYYGVSYDYLLGKSPCKKRENIDVNNKLGLSDKSISKLETFNNTKQKPYQTPYNDTLNSFIQSDEFDYFIDTLSKCKYAYFLKDQGLIFNEAAKEEVRSTITDEQRRLSLEGKMILVEPSNYFDILMSTLQGITRNIAQEISED